MFIYDFFSVVVEYIPFPLVVLFLCICVFGCCFVFGVAFFFLSLSLSFILLILCLAPSLSRFSFNSGWKPLLEFHVIGPGGG